MAADFWSRGTAGRAAGEWAKQKPCGQDLDRLGRFVQCFDSDRRKRRSVDCGKRHGDAGRERSGKISAVLCNRAAFRSRRGTLHGGAVRWGHCDSDDEARKEESNSIVTKLRVPRLGADLMILFFKDQEIK